MLEVKQGETTIVTYAYDYAGKRVRKAAGATVTQFCYDGDQIIADYNDSGVLQRRYVYGPGIDEPICMIDVKNGNAMYYYHFDGLGSVAALSDTSGNIVEKYKYDVYGKPTIRGPSDEPRTTSDVNNRYMFTGREYDSESGLYYYRARYYKPTIGRFMSTDPRGNSDGLNAYVYVSNSPLNASDPYGLYEWTHEGCKARFDQAWGRYVDNIKACMAPYGYSFGTGYVKCLAACSVGSIISIPFKICMWSCTGLNKGLAAWVLGKCIDAAEQERRSILNAFNYCNCRADGCDAGTCAKRHL